MTFDTYCPHITCSDENFLLVNFKIVRPTHKCSLRITNSSSSEHQPIAGGPLEATVKIT